MATKDEKKRDDHSEHQLDVVNANRGVWLVKVPKYMAQKWQSAKAMSEIGRLKITK